MLLLRSRKLAEKRDEIRRLVHRQQVMSGRRLLFQKQSRKMESQGRDDGNCHHGDGDEARTGTPQARGDSNGTAIQQAGKNADDDRRAGRAKSSPVENAAQEDDELSREQKGNYDAERLLTSVLHSDETTSRTVALTKPS